MPTVGPVERALALRSLPLFQTLPAREVSLLAQLLREQVVPRGQRLQTAGDRIDAVHLLIDGRVRLQRDGADATCVEAPEALGLVELLAGVPTRDTAIADSDVVALVIDRGAFLDLLDDQFSLVLHLRDGLGREIAARHAAAPRDDAAAVGGQPPQPGRAPLDIVDALLLLEDRPELRALGVAVLAALLGDEPTVSFAVGETLIDAGAEATRFLVLVTGDVSCTPADGSPAFRAGAGAVLGRDAVLTAIAYSYTAVAETPGVAIPIGAQVFWDLAEDHFHVALAALSMCAHRLLSLADLAPPDHPAVAATAEPAMEGS